MARNDTRRSPLRIVLTVLLVLVLAAGAFGGYLYVGAKQVQTHIAAANASYEQCIGQLDQQQFGEALTSVKTTIDEIAQIRQGLDGWQWDVAEKLPYLSQDVTCARQTSQIADQLASDALLPVIEQTEDIMSDASSADPLTGITDVFGKLPALYTTLNDARKVVSDCKAQADALPTSHFDQLNEWVSGVQEATTSAEETFSQLDVVFDAINTISDFTNAFVTPTTTVTAPQA